MFVDPWNPKEDEIMSWAWSDGEWPEQDWDLAVCNGKHNDLILKLARNPDCPSQNFFIHALYVIVGDSMHCNEKKDQKDLLRWVRSIEFKKGEALNSWKDDAEKVLSGSIPFDYEFWCDTALTRMTEGDFRGIK